MNKKTLPSIRIGEYDYYNLEAAIKKFNKTSLLKISKQEFRRLSYSILSQLILQDKLSELPIEFKN